MSAWTDRVVAAPAWLAHTARRILGGSGRRVSVLIGVLLLVSAIPTFAIGVSQRPTDLTFEDVRVQRIPANTTWVRLEGDLRASDTTNGTIYKLYADGDDAHAILVSALVPLEVGRQVMTGHLALGAQGAGTIGFLDADVPAVPRQNEPFWLILLPAVIAIVIFIGTRLGYPVVRRDRRHIVRAAGGDVEDAIDAHWSGRIGRDQVPNDRPIPCLIRTVAVAGLPEMADLRISSETREWTVRVRRATPVRPVRLCRIDRSTLGLEIHASTADIVCAFADRMTRDRLVAMLGQSG